MNVTKLIQIKIELIILALIKIARNPTLAEQAKTCTYRTGENMHLR